MNNVLTNSDRTKSKKIPHCRNSSKI